jgi:hypothetical protein
MADNVLVRILDGEIGIRSVKSVGDRRSGAVAALLEDPRVSRDGARPPTDHRREVMPYFFGV